MKKKILCKQSLQYQKGYRDGYAKATTKHKYRNYLEISLMSLRKEDERLRREIKLNTEKSKNIFLALEERKIRFLQLIRHNIKEIGATDFKPVVSDKNGVLYSDPVEFAIHLAENEMRLISAEDRAHLAHHGVVVPLKPLKVAA